MRIAHFTDTFLPQINGIAIALHNLSIEQARKGNEVIIFAPGHKNKPIGKEHLAPRLTVIHIPSLDIGFLYPDFRLALPINLPASLYELLRFKPDILHYHTPLTTGFEAIMASKILNKPLVGTFHTFIADPAYLQHLKIKNAKITRKIAWGYNNFFYKACDIVTTPSKVAKNKLKEKGLKKVEVISNPIFCNQFKNPKHPSSYFKKRYNLKRNVIAYWGRISPEKSIDLLLKAFALVSEKNKNVSFLIIGKGPDLKKLQQLAIELRIADSVIFTGEFPNQKLASSGILHTTDIFVTMSKTETQGITTIEAMACGLPIICVNQNGVKEMIQKNGFIIKANDYKAMAEKILYLLNYPKQAQKMSLKSKKLANQYDTAIIAQAFEKVYQKAIKIKLDKKRKKMNTW